MENFIDIFEFSNKMNNFFKMQGCVIGSTDQNFCVFCISYTERIGSDAWEVECIHAGTVHVFHLHMVSANVTALKVICVCFSYPATPASSLLLLLLLDELHGRGWRRSRPHVSHNLNAVLRERRQVQPLSHSHLHLLQLLETSQSELRCTNTQKSMDRAL